VQRQGDDGVVVSLAIEDPEHQRRGQPFDDRGVAPVLQGVDDLLAEALVAQGRKGALETEAHPLAFVADEGLEGRRPPAPGADGTTYLGQGLEAVPAEEVARPPLTADAALREEEIGEGGDV
jgi:hypothetical protein